MSDKMSIFKLVLSPLWLGLVWLSLSAGAPGYWKPEAEVVDPEKNIKRIILPLNKAAVIDLPSEAVDVLVSNPKIVEAVIRTPKRSYLMGVEVGQANAFYFDKDGKQILNLEIRVERDLETLSMLFKKFLPDARIKAEAVNDNIILSGSTPNAVQADRAREIAARFVGEPEQVLSMLSIDSGEQVMLQVRIIEMQRIVSKQFGIDSDLVFDIGDAAYGLFNKNPFSLVGDVLSQTEFQAIADRTPGRVRAEASVVALERAGLVRTLAEPTLSAVSGETANFLAGGEFPVPVSRDRDGNVTLEFKPFGVGLGFTPVVLDPGRISLKISTEVSDVTSDEAFESSRGSFFDNNGQEFIIPGVTIPSLTVRRAETTVELPSGGSMVIAGLLQDTFKHNIDGIPGIKDMPVVGALARSRDFQSDQSELVIIVTPYLVGPVGSNELKTPTDKFARASDLDTILFGRLNAAYGKEGSVLSENKLNGPHGYIVK